MKKSLALLALTAVITTGCAAKQHTIRVSDRVGLNSSVDYNRVDYEKTNSFFLGGIFQESSVDAVVVCPAGKKPAKIVTETRWYQSLIAWLTGNLYTPTKTYVVCA